MKRETKKQVARILRQLKTCSSSYFEGWADPEREREREAGPISLTKTGSPLKRYNQMHIRVPGNKIFAIIIISVLSIQMSCSYIHVCMFIGVEARMEGTTRIFLQGSVKSGLEEFDIHVCVCGLASCLQIKNWRIRIDEVQK